jgi:hypothetical protein
MAKVTRVPQIPPPPPPEDKYLLELDKEEADLIYAMVNCANGPGRRNRLASQIWSALYDEGVRSDDEPYKTPDGTVDLRGDDE